MLRLYDYYHRMKQFLPKSVIQNRSGRFRRQTFIPITRGKSIAKVDFLDIRDHFWPNTAEANKCRIFFIDQCPWPYAVCLVTG